MENNNIEKLDLRKISAISKIDSDEVFVQIQTYPRYYISNYGRVYSTDSNLLLSPGLTTDGYYTVALIHPPGGEPRSYYIHRLVAEAFCKRKNPEKQNDVHHRDKNKINNYYKNLQWVSRNEHSFLDRNVTISLYNANKGKWKQYPSFESLATRLNVPPADIRKAIRNGEPHTSYDCVTFYEFENQEGQIHYIGYTVM